MVLAVNEFNLTDEAGLHGTQWALAALHIKHSLSRCSSRSGKGGCLFWDGPLRVGEGFRGIIETVQV